jgi:antirestriction protein
MSNTFEPRVYVASLSDYNNGCLHGAWIDLTGKDADEINQEINAILAKSKFPNVYRQDCECRECGHTWTRDAREINRETICPECESNGNIMCSAQYPSAEEWAIHDYDGFGGYKINEYTSVDELVRLTEVIDENAEAFLLYASDVGLDYAIENFEEAFQGEHDSELDFTYQLVDDLGYLEQMPENLRGYFDYEAFKHDLFINDYTSERLDNGNVAVFSRYV